MRIIYYPKDKYIYHDVLLDAEDRKMPGDGGTRLVMVVHAW